MVIKSTAEYYQAQQHLASLYNHAPIKELVLAIYHWEHRNPKYHARSFAEMVDDFRPRHISTPSQYAETQAVLDLYLDLDREYTPDEADYVNLLGLVIERWEDDNCVLDDSPDDDDDDGLCDFGC